MPTNPNNETNFFDAFNSCKVRQDGDMICLTDMWRANSRPRNKRPADWQKLPSTVEMVDYLRNYLEQKRDSGFSRLPSDPIYDQEVIQNRRGHHEDSDDPGSTWAHWQLAMVYAHYLSPAFYVWCNSIIYKMMLSACHDESTGLAPRFEQNFERMHQRFDQISQYAQITLTLVSSIQKRQDGSRNDFTDRSRRLIIKAVMNETYDGNCPCCTRTKVLIVGKPRYNAQFDHFYGRALNRPEHGWLICQDCHQDLTASPMLRFSKIPAFCQFSGCVFDEAENERRQMRSGEIPYESEPGGIVIGRFDRPSPF